MSIDIRSALGAGDMQRALSSSGRDELAAETTRFVQILVCQRCLCPSRILVDGQLHCGGCLRSVTED